MKVALASYANAIYEHIFTGGDDHAAVIAGISKAADFSHQGFSSILLAFTTTVPLLAVASMV